MYMSGAWNGQRFKSTGPLANQDSDQIKKKNRQVMIAILSIASGMLFLGSSARCALHKRKRRRLLGFCVEGEERMLIYEYMPSKSLDNFIFEESRKELLTWENRFEISMGISGGLLYLYQNSRLRILHRDLKTSNILLDSDLNARISDFGLARSVGGDQYEA
ncbi:G-type lectin S-receptor-like serine threonine-kinase At4g27290 [Olea europaea subsp. europaea]|uniref:non-specific serine/threonine protein kinase n=1 Tax=Olea europaea subsp. europaea TaxID=158383 RepID=A0A8S0VGB6_OLEEU|nr:G-type lectin S-receptor-like serine threonine-kinase At4g27290 [Olea europaea subsp. europaea]